MTGLQESGPLINQSAQLVTFDSGSRMLFICRIPRALGKFGSASDIYELCCDTVQVIASKLTTVNSFNNRFKSGFELAGDCFDGVRSG
jgi:hypothetical protein